MHISFATANLYQEPFEDVLEMIAEAGYDAIELDLFWENKTWAMAQHLRGWSAKQVAASIERSGLRLSSIHDGGGVLNDPESVAGYINPDLAETIDALGYAPGCLVFHAPHVEGTQEAGWWGRMEARIAAELRPYQEICPVVTVENMPHFDGYSVPLLTSQALADFTQRFGLGVTLDTTHYAQMGVDVVAASRALSSQTRTIHLSDYQAGHTHVFVGEGELDLPGVFKVLDADRLHAVTVECSLARGNGAVQPLDRDEKIARMREARVRTEACIMPDLQSPA
ncbi:MAG: sugar phosphate isomerase/epimerase [Anaerolineaceae bacterium]|nr:sugar phosphate isomerase/epimerase [Anaerolineaceae bacterium]